LKKIKGSPSCEDYWRNLTKWDRSDSWNLCYITFALLKTVRLFFFRYQKMPFIPVNSENPTCLNRVSRHPSLGLCLPTLTQHFSQCVTSAPSRVFIDLGHFQRSLCVTRTNCKSHRKKRKTITIHFIHGLCSVEFILKFGRRKIALTNLLRTFKIFYRYHYIFIYLYLFSVIIKVFNNI
jgi:hypothetical protein